MGEDVAPPRLNHKKESLFMDTCTPPVTPDAPVKLSVIEHVDSNNVRWKLKIGLPDDRGVTLHLYEAGKLWGRPEQLLHDAASAGVCVPVQKSDLKLDLQHKSDRIEQLTKEFASKEAAPKHAITELNTWLGKVIDERNTARVEMRREKDCCLSLTAEVKRLQTRLQESGDSRVGMEKRVQHYCDLAKKWEKRAQQESNLAQTNLFGKQAHLNTLQKAVEIRDALLDKAQTELQQLAAQHNADYNTWQARLKEFDKKFNEMCSYNAGLAQQIVRLQKELKQTQDLHAQRNRDVEAATAVGNDLSERLRQAREMHRVAQARICELEKGLGAPVTPAPCTDLRGGVLAQMRSETSETTVPSVPPMPRDCFKVVKDLSGLDAGMSLRVTLRREHWESPKVVHGIARRSALFPSVWECSPKDRNTYVRLSDSDDHNKLGTRIRMLEVWDEAAEQPPEQVSAPAPVPECTLQYVDVKPVLGHNGRWTVHMHGSPHRLDKLHVGFEGVLGFVYPLSVVVPKMRLKPEWYGFSLDVPTAVRITREAAQCPVAATLKGLYK